MKTSSVAFWAGAAALFGSASARNLQVSKLSAHFNILQVVFCRIVRKRVPKECTFAREMNAVVTVLF